ncbi:MAG: hypothetical protein HQM10_17525 [Candidatus Riflebacteria bacterium]|nr:hypothetical protein [Candidatus Riflebacteria bacterium]
MTDNERKINKCIVQQWKNAGSALEKIHDEELQNYVYDSEIVDSMIELGLLHAEIRVTSGLVEMQKYFRKWHEKLS